MPDNKKEIHPLDSSTININEDYELQYWSEKFNCSVNELKDAVASVGTSVEKVEEYLGMLKGKKN